MQIVVHYSIPLAANRASITRTYAVVGDLNAGHRKREDGDVEDEGRLVDQGEGVEKSTGLVEERESGMCRAIVFSIDDSVQAGRESVSFSCSMWHDAATAGGNGARLDWRHDSFFIEVILGHWLLFHGVRHV